MFLENNTNNVEQGHKTEKWLYLSDEAERMALEQTEDVVEVTFVDSPQENSTQEIENDLDFSPSTLEFESRKAELNDAFNGYVTSLVNKIEEQAKEIIEHKKEIEEKDIQLKLIPDLQKQLVEVQEEKNLDHFEAQALKKQIALLKDDKDTSEKIARITKAILTEVENDAKERSLEIESARQTKEKLVQLQNELASMKKSWWQKLLGL